MVTASQTRALFQCGFEAESAKPTRIMSDLPACAQEPGQGWPVFSAPGHYVAPLERRCPHATHKVQLKGRTASGEFRTMSSASYPPAMCRWLAHLVASSLKVGRKATGEKEEKRKRDPTSRRREASGAHQWSTGEAPEEHPRFPSFRFFPRSWFSP